MNMNWLRSFAKKILRHRVGPSLNVLKAGDGKVYSMLRSSSKHLTADANVDRLMPTAKRQCNLKAQLIGKKRITSYRHVMQEMDAGEVLEGVSSPPEGLLLLSRLVELRKPRYAVEIGSAFGIASLAIAAAMGGVRDARFDGFEFEEWRAEIAGEGISELLEGRALVHSGPVELILPEIAKNRVPIEFAFVDARHTFEDTKGYHNLLMSLSKTGICVVYDDINWSDGMTEFWLSLLADTRVTEAVLVGGRYGVILADA